MKCPNCNNEMVQSHAGWLCLSCGHLEKIGTPADMPEVAVGQGPHNHISPVPAKKLRIVDPIKSPEPAEPPAPKDTSPDPGPAPVVDPEPASEPDPPTEPPVSPVPDNPEPPAEPKPEPPVEQASEPVPPAPDPEPPDDPGDSPSVDSEPSSTPPPPPIDASPPGDKPPLTPSTHPKSTGSGLVTALVVVIAVVGLAGGTLAYAAASKPASTWISNPPPKVVTPDPSATNSTNASPTPSPTASPAAVTTVSPAAAATATTRDTARQAALAAYIAAYRATGVNGFYAVKPPAVSVSATDPTTGQAFVISTNPPTTVGQIQYLPGGVCGGPSVTPGKTATHYIALKLKLESSPTLYCLQVK